MPSAQPSPDYRAVFAALPLPATLIDPAGVIVDLNDASLQVAQRVGRRVTKADRIGQDFAAFAVRPEDGARLATMVERALREGAAEEPLWEFRDAAGTPFWMEFHAAAVHDAAKRSTGVVVLRHDVTERVRHERLRDCQERLHEALWHLTGTNALGGLLEILHRELVTLCPQTANSSVQLRPVNGQPWTSYHLSADGVQLAQSRLESNRAVTACWEEQRPVYRPDLATTDQYGEAAEIWDPEAGYDSEVRSVLDVPFAHGTLAVNSHRPHAYAEDEIRAIGNLAQVLSLGLARIEDQQRLAERNRQLEEEVAERQLAQEALQASEERFRLDLSLQRLRVAVSLMRGEEDWTTVVQTAHRELAAWVPVNAVTINVLDLETDTLAVIGVGPDLVAHAAPRGRPRPEVMTALGAVFSTGEPLYRPSRRDPLFPLDMPDDVNSVVDVAFLGGTIGVNHTREDAFTDRDVEVIAEFAGVISEGYRRLQDLTALRESEERFRQAQKMEAVGLLAGGVAHDFNNLLTVVLGQAQLALQRTDQPPEMRELLEEIERAGRRGAGLVQQLLAFSRRQTRRPERLDLNAAVAESTRMLRQLLGDDIELVTLLDREPIGVEMDRGQLTQLILNLAVNARDAMPDGGRLTLRTSVRTVTAGEPHSGVLKEPGRYAVLTVEDTGTGMPPEVQKRIFEPFFTTKEEGRGTGLGLAMVHAAVSQSRGQIEVSSEVDQGSTFTIFLPEAEPSRGDRADTDGEDRAAAESRSILVVDDDEAVRQVVCRMLRVCGYAVVPAASGVEALEAVHARGVRVDLLLTDVSMPGMNGWQLAATMRAEIPALPVLFMSGRPDGGAPSELAAAGTAFLPKPIQLRDLQRQVQALLDPGV